MPQCPALSFKENCGYKTTPEKTGRGSHKTTVMFSCFVLPSLFFPEAILAWYKSLPGAAKSSCGSLRSRPSNQVVSQTLPGIRETTTEQATFASVFQKQPPKVCGLPWRTWTLKAQLHVGYWPPGSACNALFHFFWRVPVSKTKTGGWQSFKQKIDIDNMLVAGISKQANSGHLGKLTSFAGHPTPQDTQQCLSIVNKHQNLRRTYKTQISGPLPLLSNSVGSRWGLRLSREFPGNAGTGSGTML